MPLTARAVVPFFVLTVFSAVAGAQTGPSDPQVIAAASTAKVNVNGKKLGGFVAATVRVGGIPAWAARRIPNVGQRPWPSERSNNSTGKLDSSPPSTHVAPLTRTGWKANGIAEDARTACATENSSGLTP